MKTIQISSGGGIGAGALVWIAMIILKATGTIAMSWFWVLSSIVWIPLGIIFGIIFIVSLILVVIDR